MGSTNGHQHSKGWEPCPHCGERHPSSEQVMDFLAGRGNYTLEDKEVTLTVDLKMGFALAMALALAQDWAMLEPADPALRDAFLKVDEEIERQVAEQT